ncbi:hypothetical protein ACH4UT_10390 [Streptomyces sp. NPDC020799]|uniref:hypothetical protein n=1 Tax=Streptomyces sp. NPDC020799 TaxID=3365091 RepID=UPI003483AF54
MLNRLLPLKDVADIIDDLGLTGIQTRLAACDVQLVVYRAWIRRAPTKARQDFEGFVDAVPSCHWPLMFEVCALRLLGRRGKARVLLDAAQALEVLHADHRVGADPTRPHRAPNEEIA